MRRITRVAGMVMNVLSRWRACNLWFMYGALGGGWIEKPDERTQFSTGPRPN